MEGNVDGTVGGSFFSLFYLVSRLDRSRYRPLVVFRADNPIIPDFHAAGVETRVIPARPAVVLPTPIGRIAAKAGNFIRGFVLEPWQLARMMRRERIDLVHLNNSITRNHVWMIAARMARIPCVTHERGINPHYLQRSLTPRARPRSSDLHLGCGAGKFCRPRHPWIEACHDTERARSRGVARSARPRLRCDESYGLPPERPLVGMVGNIKHWKGQEVLIRALADA